MTALQNNIRTDYRSDIYKMTAFLPLLYPDLFFLFDIHTVSCPLYSGKNPFSICIFLRACYFISFSIYKRRTAASTQRAHLPKERLDTMEEAIREKLEELRGMLQADGGDLEVVSITGKTVFLRLRGACGACPHAQMTLKDGIERILRESVDPEIVVERA